MASYKILFVDDDPEILRALGSFFHKLGHEVHSAESGPEAIATYERVRPDVTVLDVVMPGMSGMEVLQTLRERRAMVIMLTGKGEIETAVEAMRMGAENFLTKPVDLNHLGATIEKAAEKGQLQQENVALKRALRPGAKRKLARLALVVLLVALSTGIGSLIGGRGRSERPRGPIPISLDSTDTLHSGRIASPADEQRGSRR